MQLSGEGSTDGSVSLLQKWSDVWGTYIDVEEIDDLEDKDKVTIVPNPTSQQPSSAKVYKLGGVAMNVRSSVHENL